MKKQPGINFKQEEEGILVGMHLDTFIAYWREKCNGSGWINFIIKERNEPTDKGYTHEFILPKKAGNDAG